MKDLARDVERKLDDHEVGKLLMTIEGLSPLTTARRSRSSEIGPLDSPGAIASYVGVIRRIRLDAKIADRSLERGDSPQTLPPIMPALPASEKRLTDSTVSSAANTTNESGGEAEIAGGVEMGVGPRRGVYGALAGRLTAETAAVSIVDDVVQKETAIYRHVPSFVVFRLSL